MHRPIHRRRYYRGRRGHGGCSSWASSSRLKALDVLFRALATVRPEVAVALRLVYHNSEQLMQLQALAKQLSIDDIVTFVGSRDAAGMLEEYRLADMLLLPSLELNRCRA